MVSQIGEDLDTLKISMVVICIFESCEMLL